MHHTLFDNQSVAFLMMPGFVAALLAQLVNWRINGDIPGVRWWSAGIAMQLIAILIRVTHTGEPTPFGILVADFCAIGGQFVLLYGLCRFIARPMFTKTTVVALAAQLLALAYFSMVADSILARTFIFGAGLAVACGLQFWLLPPLARREGWSGVIVLMGAYGLTLFGILMRGVALALWGNQAVGAIHVGESMALDGRQAISALLVTVIATGYSFGYILIVTNRTRWQLRQMATVDALTGLPNRRAFDAEIMHAALRVRRDHGRLGLALIDLDHFKKVNDTYGHAAGDALLRHFAAVVIDSLRETDFFARVGGEEFALVVTDSGPDSIQLAADRIRLAVERTSLVLPAGVLTATISAGTAVSDPGEGDVEDLYRIADEALYRAKANGRNRVERGAMGRRISLVMPANVAE